MIIGLTGKKSAGKDTVADYLIEQYGFVKLSFAWLLKQSAARLFDIDPKAWETYKNDPSVRIELYEGELLMSTFTAREFLQRYGTEAHREVFGSNFWVDALWNDVIDHPEWSTPDFVIPDCRFANEAASIKKLDGQVWRIVRPGQDEADGHASEDLSQTDPFVLLELQNDGGFENLYNAVDEALDG